MTTHLRRSMDQPIREGLSWDELWRGPDRGLICCWERGRQQRVTEPDLAARADRGELVELAWRGGVEKKLKIKRKSGTLHYLATWQGLRGQDLDIVTEGETLVECSKTKQVVALSHELPEDDELPEDRE